MLGAEVLWVKLNVKSYWVKLKEKSYWVKNKLKQKSHYRVFGNERYKSFCLLHRLKFVPRPKTCGKIVLYIGHFDIL